MSIAELFVRHLLAYEGIAAVNLRPGDQAIGEPDSLCVVDGAPRGIELVDCWISAARASWALSMGFEGLEGLGFFMSGPVDPRLHDETYAGDLSRDVLVRVAETRMRETWKAYAMRTWLILNASQSIIIWHDARSGPSLVGQIRKPAGYPFDDVYLCLAPDSWSADPRQFYREEGQRDGPKWPVALWTVRPLS
jgi:hypothetical protein